MFRLDDIVHPIDRLLSTSLPRKVISTTFALPEIYPELKDTKRKKILWTKIITPLSHEDKIIAEARYLRKTAAPER